MDLLKLDAPITTLIAAADEIMPDPLTRAKGDAAAAPMPEAVQRKVDEVFHRSDSDGSNVLTYAKLLRATDNSTELADHMKAVMDTNKNGEIDLTEWNKFFGR